MLLHLNEIERRLLHLKQGYSSMFDYCTSGLGYSASAAMRRIRTARCVARFPELYELLKSNEVNLSTVSRVSRILTRENKDQILSRIRGKSQREVEAIVAEYEPHASVPADRVRTVMVRVPVVSVDAALSMPVPDTGTVSPGPGRHPVAVGEAGETDECNRSGCASDTPALPARAGEVSAAAETQDHNRSGCNSNPMARLERRALIQFSASEAFMAKLEKVRSLAWHRLPANASLEQVFELALDVIIDKEDPYIRRERSERRKISRASHEAKSSTSTPKPSTNNARHIPATTRDKVYVRDRGRCTFVGPNGRRCASTRALQIDHVKPVAFGGDGTPDNLRLLCAYHNRLEAERLLRSASRRYGPSPG